MRLLLFFVGIIFSLFPAPLFAQNSDDQALSDLQQLQQTVDDFRQTIAEVDARAQDIPNVDSREIRTSITRIIREYEENGFRQAVLEFELDGSLYQIDTGDAYTEGLRYRLREGQPIYVQILYRDNEVSDLFLVDIVRIGPLLLLILFFCVLVVAIGYWRGLQAIFGLAITLAIIFGYLIPRILAGADPVLHTVISAAIILAVNMHLSHGRSRQTFAAFLATQVGLLFAVAFSSFFVWFANLSGLSSESTVLFYFQTGGFQVPSGILLAGIILGAVGVLDDIAITQSETIAELRSANPDLTRRELYMRAMRVGRHHIASTVNTLVLAYAGVALPIFLLFSLTSDVGFLRFLNEEFIAEEVVRTLAGTSALILTVPIATLFATFVQGEDGHHHEH